MAYTVKAGDTGNSIASSLGITFAALSAANPSVNWNNLQIGQELQVPGGGQATTYKVVSGDTGNAIASKLGISFAALSAANPGVNWNNLQIGQVLQVPSEGSTTPTTPPSTGDDSGTNGDPTVRSYSGPASNFPDPSQWQKYSLMWAADSNLMVRNDTAEQIGFIKEAIETVSASSGIDRRVILSVIMQESGGNVHVPTTVSPAPDYIRNPGLMQSHNGSEFDENNQQGSILQMIRDGTEGTSSGDGLKQCYQHQGNIYAALREYNSGSVNKDNLSSGVGTPSYVSDVANRLMGAQPN